MSMGGTDRDQAIDYSAKVEIGMVKRTCFDNTCSEMGAVMTRYLASGDWHLDCSTAGKSRFDDVRDATDDLVATAIGMAVDAFIFVGDLTNPETQRAHASVEVAARVAAFLWFEHGIMSRWLVGNHDVIEDGSGAHTLAALRGMASGIGGNGIRVYDRPTCEMMFGVAVVALPFTARSHAYDPAEFIREVEVDTTRPDRVVVLSHLNIEGIESGSETSEMPRGRDVFLPLAEIRKRWPDAVIVNGHYHKRQTFKGIEVTGSLERLTFGEQENNPGFLILEA
jgi:DNA repair exonuclease SbcCD nuclease subunit